MLRDMTDMKIAVVPGDVAILIGGALEGARGPSGREVVLRSRLVGGLVS